MRDYVLLKKDGTKVIGEYGSFQDALATKKAMTSQFGDIYLVLATREALFQFDCVRDFYGL